MTRPLPTRTTRLLSKKNELGVSKVATVALSSPSHGETVLALERFALTTNNITYAAFGESMRYWQFFPTGQADWGHMPVWGIARVIESSVADVDPDQRYYGYYPIAEHLVCKPHRVCARGFADSTDYRQALPSAYNYYSLYGPDAATMPQRENYEMLIRPLFLTSYLLADYLQDNDYFDAEQVVISSASSKTAYGLAYCLADVSIPLRGLTSARNAAFVEGLRCYTDVALYDQLEFIDNKVATLYVDFRGDEALRKSVHKHFSTCLKHDCFVGSAANFEPPKPDPSFNVATKFFFAADHVKKLNRELGAELLNQKMGDTQDRFIEKISDISDPWLTIVENNGIESAEQVIRSLCANEVGAHEGHIVALGG